MPIVGLTDRGLALPVIGKIRKGTKETITRGGKTFDKPVDLKYFNVQFDVLEGDAEIIFRNIYGNEPNNILIMLPFDEMDRVWDAWLKAFTYSRMVGRSDGKIIDYLIDPASGEILVRNGVFEADGTPATHTDQIGKDQSGNPIKWKASGILKVILPELKKAAILEVATSSIWDVVNITSNLQAVREIAGKLSYIPLRLKRVPRKIGIPGKKKGERMRVEKWLLQIEIEPQWMKARIDQGYIAALPQVETDAPLLLPDQFESAAIDEEVEAEIIEEGGDNGEEGEDDLNKRPYKPADLLSRIKKAGAILNDRNIEKKKIAPADKKLLNKIFEIALPGSETAYTKGVREVILLEFFGMPTTAKIEDYGLTMAILNSWLNVTQDAGGEYKVNKHAEPEIVDLYEYLIKPAEDKPVDLSGLTEIPE